MNRNTSRSGRVRAAVGTRPMVVHSKRSLRDWLLAAAIVFALPTTSDGQSTTLPRTHARPATGAGSRELTVPGVSAALAARRRTQIADVRYDLGIDVRRDTAVGRVAVTFTSKVPGDVVLDFRGLAVDSLIVNGLTKDVSSARWNGAHLVIDSTLILSGRNRLEIGFRSPIAPAGASIIRTHDATAPTRARRLADIGLAGDDAVARLIQDGVIRPVDSRGRLTVLGDSIDRVAGYYLDEAAYIVNRDGADRASSRKGVLLACAAVVVAAGAALVILASVNR